ncbi:hypothetical protein C4F40_03470 [Sphingobacterium sp. Ka21]|uniref:Fibronectin type-III domain-containing protein n=2 Tax=Sphingobacterium pedocola TaxID=2082722 RepID=A0ABR9T468_9SPHI|nr:hypothetical protein [Sphingobacterium pedocola]
MDHPVHEKNKKMAIKAKALISFSRMKDDELVVTANTIVGAMTDNSNYPAPAPVLDDVQVLLDDFTGKLAISRKRGSPEDTAIKNDSKEPLAEALQQLAYYVNSVAKGRLAVLLSSGFPTNNMGSAALVPLMVESVKMSDGRQSGQARLNFAAQRGALIYEYQYRMITQPESEWSDRLTTTSSRNNILAPLEVGKRYEVRVRAVNTQGAGDWSQTASILVR